MMRPRLQSIRSKLVWLTTAIAVAAIVLVTTVTAWHAYDTRRQALMDELTAIARILAANIQAPLIFNDPEAATEILESLTSRPIVLSAKIVDTDDKLFAEYLASGPALQDDAAQIAEISRIHTVRVPISWTVKPLGSLELKSSLSALDDAIVDILQISAALAVGATLVAWLLARLLGGAISRPIEHLVETMERVSSTRDFSQRAIRTTDDETGRQIDGFNEMIERIESSHLELAKARDVAEQSSQSKTRFLATMSHELRTPLNAIMGFSEVIRDGMLGNRPEAYRSYAGDVHSSASYLLNLINDLLDMSRLDSNAYTLDEHETWIGALLLDCSAMLATQAAKHGVQLSVASEGTDTLILADDRALRQVIINLIGNAVKFTPSGERVTISSEVGDDGTCAISVSDTGPGIPPEDLERVMEPFEQVRSHLSREHDGSGLGLAISRNLVELHGGTLRLESTVGIGTTATIVLPAERVLGVQLATLSQPKQSAYS